MPITAQALATVRATSYRRFMDMIKTIHTIRS